MGLFKRKIVGDPIKRATGHRSVKASDDNSGIAFKERYRTGPAVLKLLRA